MKPWLCEVVELIWGSGGGGKHSSKQVPSCTCHKQQTKRSKIASCGDRLCHNQLVYFW